MTTPKKTKEEVLAQMTADAELAREEFDDLMGSMAMDKDTVDNLRSWWEKWFQKAGHKRLAYILMNKKLSGE